MTQIIEIKNNWNETKSKLKQKFAILTDNNLLPGEKQDEILKKLQVKLGKTRDEIQTLIASL